MRIEKHLIGQKVIVRYMEDTDSNILGLGFLITSSIMWISNRGQTSDWPKSDCSVHGRYRQRYLTVRVFNNFVNNVDIEPWSRILC